MSHRIYKSEFWEQKIQTLKDRGISPLTAIDIGANIGEWCVNFKSYFPNAEVLSIEANTQFESELKQNNPNYLISLMGDSNKDGVEFYINPNTNNDVGGSIYKESTQWSNDSFPVKLPMITLDSLGKRFDWVKMDVQGAELDVLMGGINTILNSVIIELELSIMQYNQGAPSASEVISWLWGHGFELFDITEHIYIEENDDDIHKLAQINVLFLNSQYSHLLKITG